MTALMILVTAVGLCLSLLLVLNVRSKSAKPVKPSKPRWFVDVHAVERCEGWKDVYGALGVFLRDSDSGRWHLIEPVENECLLDTILRAEAQALELNSLRLGR